MAMELIVRAKPTNLNPTPHPRQFQYHIFSFILRLCNGVADICLKNRILYSQ